MTKLKKVLSGFFGLYILAALPLAQAQIYNQLDLTAGQKQALEANKHQHRAQMENARQEMRIYKEEMRQALMAPQLDMPKINQIHGRIKSLQNQMEDDKLNSILAVRAILTPEQFLKFVSLMHKHRQEHE